MHSKIFPTKDTYIENIPSSYLKDFSRDELLEVCVLKPEVSIYTSSLSSGSFDMNVENASVICFMGTLTGSMSGSAAFITGSVSGSNIILVMDEC